MGAILPVTASPVRAVMPHVEIEPSTVQKRPTPLPFAKDTMSSARPAEKDFTLSKPQLTVPQYRILGAVNGLEEINSELIDLQIGMIKHIQDKFKQLSAENAQKIRERAANDNTNWMWSTLKKIANFITSAINLILGYTFYTAAGTAAVGACLILSGALGIINLLLADTGAWDWVAKKLAQDNEEKRKTIAHAIPTAIDVLNAIASLTAIAVGAVGGALNAQRLLPMAQTAGRSAEGLAKLGKGVAESQSSIINAETKQIEQKFRMNRYDLEENTSKLKKILENQRDFTSKAGKFIKDSVRCNQGIISLTG